MDVLARRHLACTRMSCAVLVQQAAHRMPHGLARIHSTRSQALDGSEHAAFFFQLRSLNVDS